MSKKKALGLIALGASLTLNGYLLHLPKKSGQDLTNEYRISQLVNCAHGKEVQCSLVIDDNMLTCGLSKAGDYLTH